LYQNQICTLYLPHLFQQMVILVYLYSGKWLACQSLDNKVAIYSVGDRIKVNRKKLFNGHLVAGYTCKPNFSTDGRFVMSGDSEGKMWFWVR
jgi:hypothetical protein